jgi:hypothetical protein
MSPKVQVEQISFGYSETTEGVPDARGKKFESWKEANSWLMHRAACLPHDLLGYLKHDFTIRWKDGYEYKGRYDLEPLRGTGDFEGLDAHIRNHVLFHAGLRRPGHMTEEKYLAYLNTFPFGQRQEYAAWIEKYQVGEELTQPVPGVTMVTRVVEVSVTVPEAMPEAKVTGIVDKAIEQGLGWIEFTEGKASFKPRFGKAKIRGSNG